MWRPGCGARSQREGAATGEAQAEAVTPPSETIGDLLDLDDIHVEFAPDLVALALDPATGLDARIRTMREHVARGFGLILPEMRLTDRPDLPPGTYTIRLLGVRNMPAPSCGRAGCFALVGDRPEALPRGRGREGAGLRRARALDRGPKIARRPRWRGRRWSRRPRFWRLICWRCSSATLRGF